MAVDEPLAVLAPARSHLTHADVSTAAGSTGVGKPRRIDTAAGAFDPGGWRRADQRGSRRLPHGGGADGFADRLGRDEHVAGVSGVDALRRPSRRPLASTASASGALTPDGGHRTRVCCLSSFWPLAVVGLIGTLNPSGGDVSAFQPTEQALLPDTVDDSERTALFARYSLLGSLVAAIGAACSAALPEWIADRTTASLTETLRWAFLAYAGLGLATLVRYAALSPGPEAIDRGLRRASGNRNRRSTASPHSSVSTRSGAVSPSRRSSCCGSNAGLACRLRSPARCSSGPACSLPGHSFWPLAWPPASASFARCRSPICRPTASSSRQRSCRTPPLPSAVSSLGPPSPKWTFQPAVRMSWPWSARPSDRRPPASPACLEASSPPSHPLSPVGFSPSRRSVGR